MKKQLLGFCASVLALMFAGTALAQDKDSMQMLPPVTVYTTSNVNQAVTKSFNKNFKDAINPKWYQLNKNYLVTFIQNDMKNKALFQKNGYLIYNISYGGEQNLPEEIRKQIQSNYSDYNITNAVNVKEANRNIWVVNLEGLKKLVMVRVEEGELEEVGNYQKSM